MDFVRRFARCSALPIAGVLLFASVGVAGATARSSPPRAWSGNALYAPPRLAIPAAFPDAMRKIKHVVIIMQENRSFDDLFQGYPGADTQSYGYDSNGNKITLQPIGLEAPYDIEHDIYSYFTACNGTGSIPGTSCQMNGFNNEGNSCYNNCTNPQYGYVPASETTPYFAMANQYVVGDRMFTSHIDDSFISHQYIIAAQADGAAYFPNSSWGCEGGPKDTIMTLNQNRTFGPREVVCWDINTLGDELDAANLKWRFYTSPINGDGGIWSSYQAINHIYNHKQWFKDVIVPQNKILTDVPAGKLANVTWVMPTCSTSDHGGCGSNAGPSWVTSIVNTIGESKFWNSSAIFVMWDEWGGWYDHVPPPYVDYDGLGMRVPLLIISPYAKQNYVSHVQYEHGSLLRFAEDQFGLGQLSASDTRANDPANDSFNFSQPPRPFVPFSAKLGTDYFIKAKPDLRTPDAE